MKFDAMELNTATKPYRRNHAIEIRAALVNVAYLCDALGIEVHRSGQSWKCLCPWHEEQTPSCSLSTATRDGTLWVKCHGCGEHGDALGFIAAVRGISIDRDFKEVLRTAAVLAELWEIVDELEGHGQRPQSTSPTIRRTPIAPPIVRIEQDPETFHRIASRLIDLAPLGSQRIVSKYLRSRKMLDLAKQAGWGALPWRRNLRISILANLVAEFGEIHVEATGLTRRDARTGELLLSYDYHLLLIPYRDPRTSDITTILRRRTSSGGDEDKYVVPVGRAIQWPYMIPEDFEGKNEGAALAIVEGAFDVLALRWLCREKKKNVRVIGTSGVSLWRPEWTEFAKGREVRIAFDNDKAGNLAATVLKSKLESAQSIERWTPPEGSKDWAEYVARVRQV